MVIEYNVNKVFESFFLEDCHFERKRHCTRRVEIFTIVSKTLRCAQGDTSRRMKNLFYRVLNPISNLQSLISLTKNPPARNGTGGSSRGTTQIHRMMRFPPTNIGFPDNAGIAAQTTCGANEFYAAFP